MTYGPESGDPQASPEALAAIAAFCGRPPGTVARMLAELRAADPEAGYEAVMEALDEWDSADSHAYQDRVEAGLEPEAEVEVEPF